jgi:hypothetical protein
VTLFLRLLKTDIPAKGEVLAEQIAAINSGQPTPDSFAVIPTDFKQIPGSPFAYWAGIKLRRLFVEFPSLNDYCAVKQGLATADDFRFVRIWWEVNPLLISFSKDDFKKSATWSPFAKGGKYAPYYYDLHLVVNWKNEGEDIKSVLNPDTGRPRSNIWMLKEAANEFFFRSALTWPLRTSSNVSTRAMPAGSIFGHKGPAAFVPEDSPDQLLTLLALMNSRPYSQLIELQLGAADMAARSYEVGIIKTTPIPPIASGPTHFGQLALEAYNALRYQDLAIETSHAFCLPGLAKSREAWLYSAEAMLQLESETIHKRLSAIQDEIRKSALAKYGLEEHESLTLEPSAILISPNTPDDVDEDEDISESDGNLATKLCALLQWCLGCAFGRWDVRFALDPTLLPKLQGPFDPLPRCSPGMLVGPDALPATSGSIVSEAWLRARPNVITLPDPSELDNSSTTIPNTAYPLRVDWDGIIPDDEQHPDDIVRRVQDVLELLWGKQAEAIEREACQILGVASLRDYFRQPKAFFDFHIKRYSKSRRKAPIYWLLQSAKKNYGLWLYYHRLDTDTLFKALTLYADPKLNIERTRLDDLRSRLTPNLAASERRATEKAITKQENLISELTDFRNELERIARIGLPPDFNDGVIISIASLHSLVQWKEAARMWNELTAGKYEWSTMSQRMRQKKLIKGTGD